MNIAREQKYQPQRLQVDRVDGMSQQHVRWIVAGNAPFEVTFDSNKGGMVSKTIQ